METRPRIVIDLDNTLFNFDAVFHAIALREGWIDASVAVTKESVKAAVLGADPESERRWWYLQSECYGNAIDDATMDPVLMKVMQDLVARGWEVFVVSHKSKTSFDGRARLQEAARKSLVARGVLDLIGSERLVFCETLDEKIEVIVNIKPLLIIDDLAKVVNDSRLVEFNRLHFSNEKSPDVASRETWQGIESLLQAIQSLIEGPFRLRKMRTEGTNQILSVAGEEGEFILKLFPENARGIRCARLEQMAAGTIADTPEGFGVFGSIRAMAKLKNPRVIESNAAYGNLLDLLIRTRDHIGADRIHDDCSTKSEWLLNLDRRLRQLGLDNEPRFISIMQSLRDIPEWPALGARFVLADFSPDSVVESEGKKFFLDLEDAGMSDPARFLCNLILHPRSQISLAMIERFRSELGVSHDHLAKVREFSSFEWILILMKNEKGRGLAQKRLDTLQAGGAA